ncbi:hypothetical protein C8F01DRAFT_1021946 [Mycena amicta]|nr:hypothetical protein C8F01DRAFT_1021946 [Mycena amicta]
MHYFWSVFPGEVFWMDRGYWIRPSNGRICLDLLPGPTPPYHRNSMWSFTIPRPNGIHTLNDPDREGTFISSLTLADYHRHCYLVLAEHRKIVFSVPAAVKLGTVLHYSCSTQLKSPVEITALSPEVMLNQTSWHWIQGRRLAFNSGRWTQLGDPIGDYHIMENKWTRSTTGDELFFNPSISFWLTEDMDLWLSQSNHVMNRLHASYNCEDYGTPCRGSVGIVDDPQTVVVHRIVFQIIINAHPLSKGYLFLCPAEDFEVGPSLFCWPDCPAYWSLDPTGVERLSTEEASRLGFPSFDLTSEVWVDSWDDSVYAGIRNFQRAKGFNPYTQDVARVLEHPLYNLPAEDHEFTHVVNEELEEAVDSWTLIE